MNNFAVMTISYKPYTYWVLITCTTNEPCHLTCYHTAIKPVRHKSSRVIRGVELPWGAYFCFVSYLQTEQNEPGDTLIHTFSITTWPVCQTRWFCFIGTVLDLPSPSISAIYEYHNVGSPQLTYIMRPFSAGSLCNQWIKGVPDSCPNHYKPVKDVTPDYWTTYLSAETGINQWYHFESYLPAPIPPELPISSISLTGLFTSVGSHPSANVARLSIRTHSLYFHSDTYNFLPGFWSTRTWTLFTNPHTSLPWTYSELLDLEIGLSLRKAWSVGWSQYGVCTQLYATVTRDY